MGYITVKQEAMDEFEERKSLFIGYTKRVETEDDAKAFINVIKSKHKDATHNVYAYIVGQNLEIQRYSDDGEPQGTAGIPILEVIKKSGITDCVVVVTRYFGGILLGAGGLVRAYTKGASMAIKEAGLVEKVDGILLRIIIDYDLLGKIQYICNQNQWYIEDTQYTDKVELNIYCELTLRDIIEKQIVEATNGKAIIVKEQEGIFFKEGNRLYKNI
ncbi:YigZ family protein [Clostridium sp. MSJ-4]|uniref:YigZ family protein n=1 Tax=Clostridium simiarum TaxID=2841506 RepID=A0ABS6EXN5_9CLOT|nr:YigZ family protein [Clostridium simiarum]MBU5590985.1 YigZ family protein [Clostridium simiarum]